MNKTTTTQNIIKVHFFEPKNGKNDYFFGSLRAVYEVFTPEDIGYALETLYVARIRNDERTEENSEILSRIAQSKGA